MEWSDALGLIAEIGIAITGFAGVVAALRAQGGRMGAYAAFRIGLLLVQSATAALLALFPFALHYAGLSSSTVWALSSSVLAGVILFVGFLAGPLIYRRVAPAALEDRAPGLRRIGPYSFAYMGVIVALQLTNVASIHMLWPFYVGLLGITGYSLFQFGWVLLAPGRTEVQP